MATTQQKLAAELIGSAILVVAAVTPITLLYSIHNSHIGIALTANAIAVFFVLFALIEIFGPISGAHFNPIVTGVMVLNKKTNAKLAPFYIVVQIIGGLIGIVVSNLMFLNDIGHLLAISQIQRSGYKYFSEIVATFVLIFVILMIGKADPKKAPIVVSALVCGMVFSTSSTMFANPQVTFARMFTGTASGIRPVDAIIFIAMQLIGAVLAWLTYKFIFEKVRVKCE